MVSRRHGKRLGQRETRASSGTWPSRVDASAHPGGDRRAPRDGERVFEGGGDRHSSAGSLGEVAPKTGLHEKASRVNYPFCFRSSNRLGGRGSSGDEFESSTGLPFALLEGPLSGPVHDEVRGVRVLQSKGRPRGSAAFSQSPGQGDMDPRLVALVFPRVRSLALPVAGDPAYAACCSDRP